MLYWPWRGRFFVVVELKYTFEIHKSLSLFFYLKTFRTLLILHELLYAVAYKIKGANNLYFGAQLSKFLFYAASDQERFTGEQFKFIALFPFVSVAVLAGFSLIIFPQYFQFIFTVLFIHQMFCGADFAVVSFLRKQGLTNVLTFDSREEETTYFLKCA